METKCIVCGKPVRKDEMCTGVIKNMKVTLCKEHMKDCSVCEKKVCEGA